MTHTHDNIALVEVPEGACDFKMELYSFCYLSHKWADYYTSRYLGPGSWKYLCLSTEMTEEMAREICGSFYPDQASFPPCYYDYTKDHPRPYFPTALESFASLLTALGCDPAGTYAVCVKND